MPVRLDRNYSAFLAGSAPNAQHRHSHQFARDSRNAAPKNQIDRSQCRPPSAGRSIFVRISEICCAPCSAQHVCDSIDKRRLTITFNYAERRDLEARARAAGQSVQNYIRKRLGYPPRYAGAQGTAALLPSHRDRHAAIIPIDSSNGPTGVLEEEVRVPHSLQAAERLGHGALPWS